MFACFKILWKKTALAITIDVGLEFIKINLLMETCVVQRYTFLQVVQWR